MPMRRRLNVRVWYGLAVPKLSAAGVRSSTPRRLACDQRSDSGEPGRSAYRDCHHDCPADARTEMMTVTRPPFSSLSVWRRAVGARDRLFTLAIRSSFASCGEGALIRLPVRVYGERSIAIGRQVVIGEGSWLQTLEEGFIEIGDGCRCSGFLVISAALSIVLEPDVLVARNVHILDHIHRFDRSDLPIHRQSITVPRPVRIGAGSWLGANVVVLPGVTIGRGAVVGANSIVDRDVRDRVVVVGTPAREVREIDSQ
jgi:acetyltransferase-like isoleucine patch superfamily enzyme